MPLFPPTDLAAKLVYELRSGAKDVPALVKALGKQEGVSIQAVYRALRLLAQQRMVLVQEKVATLNSRWLQQLEQFISQAEHAYREPGAGSGHFLQMQDGDKIVYSFKNPLQTDAFWNHVLYVLFDVLPGVDRWYAYASHCWFLLGHRDEELALREYMRSRGIRYLFTVGHNLPADRAIRDDFDGEWSQYAMLDTPLFLERANALGIVLNIVGDYVIEARYDRGTVERIERFYKETTRVDAAAIQRLREIVAHPAKITLIITKHETKAKRLAKQFEKFFYIKKAV